jgi:hypothetical protein
MIIDSTINNKEVSAFEDANANAENNFALSSRNTLSHHDINKVLTQLRVNFENIQC